MPLAPGQRLGPYEILSLIGEGGMGEVYKARDTRLDRIVALKVSKAEFSERFEHEARAVAALNHPHICQLHDVGPNYLVMEFIEGEPLKVPLPLNKVLQYAGQILDALDAAHRKGITHRDLKPSNIMLTKHGIKLLDFGLAKQQTTAVTSSDATVKAALTNGGEIAGTLQYMSPEQLHGKEVDCRSDLFSFGCVLYEMLSGNRAFEGESAASVIAAILDREPPSIQLTPPLSRVIATCLAKEPDQRFQNALDLKRNLIWALEERPPDRVERRPAWIALAFLLGVFAMWAAMRFYSTSLGEHVYRLQINPPENGSFLLDSNTAGGVALSPDGRTIAYVASAEGKTALWIRSLDRTAPRLIAGTDDAGFPFWSPDSKSIGFVVRGQLKRVEADGGTPSTICDAFVRGGTWGTDGKIIFGTLTSGLFRVPATGGKPEPLTRIDNGLGEYAHRWPQILPKGRLLYWVQGTTREANGVYASLTDKSQQRVRLLTNDSSAVFTSVAGKGYLLWLRSGTLVAQPFDAGSLKFDGEPHTIAERVSSGGGSVGHINVSAAAGVLLHAGVGGLTQFFWLDRAGKQVGAVGDPGLYRTSFQLSPDGGRIAAQQTNSGIAHLWLLETVRGISTPFTTGAGFVTYPVWSPDSQTILFSRLGSNNLFRKAASGVGEEQIVDRRPGTPFPVAWSSDGRLVLIRESNPASKANFWMLPVTADGKLQEGAQARPYLGKPFAQRKLRLSPESNPRWVAYDANESGRSEIYLDAFPEPRGSTRVSTNGGSEPQWSRDGRELFFVTPDNKLMSVPLNLNGGLVSPVVPRELFTLPPYWGGTTLYQPAADGQRFLVLANHDRATQPLTVVVNWHAVLKN